MARRGPRIGWVSAGLIGAAIFGSAMPPPPKPERIEAEGIENLYRLGADLYSGGQPSGERGFSTLERLGVRTIISVDGARPDVEAARRLGIRYVHLPIGYDGVPPEQALRLVKAVRELPGPIFIHCHHGKHRGPAAAAICAMAAGGWGRDQARSWLETAGTSPDYRGLFEAVDQFTMPSKDDLDRLAPTDLPERAEVRGLVEAMVEIDARWDHLRAIREAGFRPPDDAPDLDPPHEALMLAEHFREAARQPETLRRGEDFTARMAEAERAAIALRDALQALEGSPPKASKSRAAEAFTATAHSCTSCHTRFRNHRP